nr:RNA-directed DNA polymerase, eukaryota [Tanacetum cinerariifolium]
MQQPNHDQASLTPEIKVPVCVKVIRNYIDDKFMPSHSEPSRWVRYIPIKINVFAWRARRDCLPTRVNLMRRGVTLDSVNCPLCNSDEEDIHHELFRFLGASPLYSMSIFKAPKGVLKELEAVRRQFFYGADHLDNKITWAAWNKILASKQKGGLGVSSFHALN